MRRKFTGSGSLYDWRLNPSLTRGSKLLRCCCPATQAALVVAPSHRRAALRIPQGLPVAQSADVFFVLVGDVLLSYPLANHWPATTAQRGGKPSDRLSCQRLSVPSSICSWPHAWGSSRGSPPTNTSTAANGKCSATLAGAFGACIFTSLTAKTAGQSGPSQLRPVWASRLRRMLTDKAYCGQFAQHVQVLGWQHHVASRPPSATSGFVPVGPAPSREAHNGPPCGLAASCQLDHDLTPSKN